MLRSQIGNRLSALSPRAKLIAMMGSDSIFLPLCVVASVALRRGSLEAALETALVVQLAIGLLALPVLGFAGLYRAVVRYIDLRVIAASSISLAIVVLILLVAAFAFDVRALPRSALLIYWFVAFTYVVTSRFMARTLLRQTFRSGGRPRMRTAIYGAGAAGAQLAQAMDYSAEYMAVCFVDDSGKLHSKTVAGLPVYSPERIRDVMERHAVEQIVVAIPSAGTARKRALIRQVEHAGLPVKILPGLTDLVNGNASVSDIREVDVADLLGRDPVPPQPLLFSRNIEGKVVLVTGAGGSIGSEICRQIASQSPARLVLLDHSEYSLYAIDHDLRDGPHALELVPVLGSVLDASLLRDLISRHKIQTIYHAAAYKHVPLVEGNVQQGLRNNVFGSLAVARAAVEGQVETCVLVSTDKAVRPTNIMGASKRVAELVFQAAALRSGTRTRFAIVRFGNVLGSSGSVVPLFKRQIQAGGPITITHPEIIRYFMLIPEAAQLVIQAGAMARGGEVFVLEMGEPVKIAELARSMIHLSGLLEKTEADGDGDIEIKYIGLRPGEKLFEELLIGDDVMPSGHPRILCARENHVDPALLDKMLESLRMACEANDLPTMLRLLRNLVPEYRPGQDVEGASREALPAR